MRHRTKTHLRLLLRRLTLYLFLPAALVLSTRLLWSLHANHDLAAIHARLISLGLPTTTASFQTPPIPDDNNAVIPLLHAATNIPILTTPQHNALYAAHPTAAAPDDPLTPDQLATLDELLLQLAPLFTDISAISDRSAIHWPDTMLQPRNLNPRVGRGYFTADVAALAQYTALKAHREHDRASEPAAITALDDMLTLSRTLDTYPVVAAHAVAARIRFETCTLLDAWLPDFPIDDATLPPLHRLLNLLADDAPFTANRLRDYQLTLLAIAPLADQFTPQFHTWLLRPLDTEELARIYETRADEFPAITSPFYNPALLPPDTLLKDEVLIAITRPVSSPEYGFNTRLQFDALTLTASRALSLLLAARFYEAQNHHPPVLATDLASLLPALPLDPFDPALKPLRVRLDPTGPTVWSVGNDARDQAGLLTPASSRYLPLRNLEPDIVYGAAWRDLLTRSTKSPAPHTPPPTSHPAK